MPVGFTPFFYLSPSLDQILIPSSPSQSPMASTFSTSPTHVPCLLWAPAHELYFPQVGDSQLPQCSNMLLCASGTMPGIHLHLYLGAVSPSWNWKAATEGRHLGTVSSGFPTLGMCHNIFRDSCLGDSWTHCSGCHLIRHQSTLPMAS